MPASDHSPAAKRPGGAVFPHGNLTGIAGLQPHEFVFLLDEAEKCVDWNRRTAKTEHPLDGVRQFNAFFQNSTGTLLPLEIAGQRPVARRLTRSEDSPVAKQD